MVKPNQSVQHQNYAVRGEVDMVQGDGCQATLPHQGAVRYGPVYVGVWKKTILSCIMMTVADVSRQCFSRLKFNTFYC